MSKIGHRWSVRLTHAAETDFRDIVEWTATHFGAAQAETYATTLSEAIEALVNGPNILGVRQREDILPGLFALHVGRRRRKGRHIVLFRIDIKNTQLIEVLRLLHDAMEIKRHLPK